MKTVLLLQLLGVAFSVRLGGYEKIEESLIPDEVLNKAKDTLLSVVSANSLTTVDIRSHIVDSERQLVAGFNYHFVVDVDSSQTSNGVALTCDFVVFYQTWTHTIELTKSECTPKTKRQTDDCSDPLMQDAVREATRYINSMANSMFHLTPVKVSNCIHQKQRYSFNISFQQSTCMNNEEHLTSLIDDCPASNTATHTDHFHCEIVETAEVLNSRYTTKCQVMHRPETVIGNDGHDWCHQGLFKDFQTKYRKYYSSSKEEEKRYSIFCDNMKKAYKLQQTDKGTAVYGATKFADMTEKEFQRFVGKKWKLLENKNKNMKKALISQIEVPESFDWREHNAVTEVKNQGSCGSCWAFSTTGNIEGQWAIKKKSLISLSEQELVDCDKLDQGCQGGLPSNAYKEIERLGGLETESQYKYTESGDEKCYFNRSDVRVVISGSLSIPSNETEMAIWLFENGPISIGINAFAMQFYMGGISHPWKIFCNPKDLDHGVLIVGYGVDGNKPYWIVKNSWGPDWGEKGYYLVYRGAGVCGLNTMCTSAIVN